MRPRWLQVYTRLPVEEYKPSYWLLGDDQLDLAKDPFKKDQFVANFKHSLLFNPSLLFSDSMVINNRNFRHLVENDVAFRELINPSTFFVAIREHNDGNPRCLLELKKEFIEKNKSRVTELDHSEDGLDFINRSSQKINYSSEQLANFFREQSISLFEEDAVQERLPDGIWRDVRDIALEAKDSLGQNFGLNFYFYELEGILKSRRNDINDCHIEYIKQFAQHPYVTALPNAINTTSIYAPKHRAAFDICGGRSQMRLMDKHSQMQSIELRTGLAAFAKGIKLLSSQDILELRKTDEAAEYFNARLELDREDFEYSREGFIIAFAAYISRIEDRILSRFGRVNSADTRTLTVSFDLKERKIMGLVDGLENASDQFTYVTVAAAAVGFSVAAYLSLLFVNPVKKACALIATGKTPSELQNEAYNIKNLQKQELIDKWTETHKMILTENVFRTKKQYIPNETIYTAPQIL